MSLIQKQSAQISMNKKNIIISNSESIFPSITTDGGRKFVGASFVFVVSFLFSSFSGFWGVKSGVFLALRSTSTFDFSKLRSSSTAVERKAKIVG